ncbi:MAG: formylglycine-generating enzyme family protein [Spirochaetaceae bacterium]|jgi:formylglycine-generating enzyme required for sulfatase activity|nr:formylglycine-generating enzyme family protein [Spirochaetaceae bacterium]
MRKILQKMAAIAAVTVLFLSGCSNPGDTSTGDTTGVTFTSLTADGSATATTTKLTLTFDKDITGLSAADITLTSGSTGAVKGSLARTGTGVYELAVAGITAGGSVTVAVSKSGYTITGGPKTVTVYRYVSPTDIAAAFTNLTADGSAAATTAKLTLTFDKDITGLSAEDITLDGGSTGVVKGSLTRTGTGVYELAVAGIMAGGSVTVAVSKSGYTITGGLKTVTVYRYTAPVGSHIEMVWVSGGSFQMGTAYGGDSDERPVHTVTLAGFYMGKYPVTQEQYHAVMGSNPSYFTGPYFPVERVSWYDAIVFCNKLSVAEGLTPAYSISGSTNPSDWGAVPTSSNGTWNAAVIVSDSTGYRLPTEAQWEYAAKGGDGSPGNYTYSGSNTIGDVAWYGGNSSNRTHAVGGKLPNGLGIYDMTGNVWEWCWDWYGYYSNGAQTDPAGAVSGSERVARGGSGGTTGLEYLSSAHRANIYPNDRRNDYGFRLVCPSNSDSGGTPAVFTNLTADGSAAATTAKLTLTFDKDITGLSTADITLTAGSTGAVKGSLARTGTGVYELVVSGISAGGSVTVAVSKFGYNITGGAKTVAVYWTPPVIEMIYVPGGSFQMGNPDTSVGYDDERPVHTVTLSGFYMGKYQVTQAQYQAVMGSNPSGFSSNPASGEVQGNRPVEYVSWYDAIVFCNKLSIADGLTPAYRISGSTNPSDWGAVPTSSNNSTWDAAVIVSGSTGYRLPTEAQWEYAAKGGNNSPGNYTYSGSNTIDNVAWYGYWENGGFEGTHEVGKKSPNGLGLYDMSGNVWEWCWDWYGSYSSGAQTDPVGAASGSARVVRGGCWYFGASGARSVCRGRYDPGGRGDDGGFRLVRP